MHANRIEKSDVVFQPKPTTRGFKDLEGMVFGRLTVLGYAGKRSGNAAWFVECECGQITIIVTYCLTSETYGTRSCGCKRNEVTAERMTKHGDSAKNGDKTLMMLRNGILSRCYNKKCKAYKNYGGRGIVVHESWINSYEAFRDDILNEIGPCPEGKSIDRIDNDRGYEPGNVRWATPLEQARNKRSVKMIVIDGIGRCAAEWATFPGAAEASTIRYRRKIGWGPEASVFGKRRHKSAVPNVAASE